VADGGGATRWSEAPGEVPGARRATPGGRYGAAVDVDREKHVAAAAAAQIVESGMTVGLGTGSTVAAFLPLLAARGLSLRCVATSLQTEEEARTLGLAVEPFAGSGALDRLDIAVDGADQVAPDGWVIKGGGGAHTREKLVAVAADRFVVIVSSDKPVDRLRAPVPVELLSFGLAGTLRRLGHVTVRDAPPSPDGNVLADYHGDVDDPATLAATLAAVPGVVDHGLFPPSLVSEILIGRGDEVERRAPTP
jgi:ribose 5-phosphate isomerase A